MLCARLIRRARSRMGQYEPWNLGFWGIELWRVRRSRIVPGHDSGKFADEDTRRLARLNREAGAG